MSSTKQNGNYGDVEIDDDDDEEEGGKRRRRRGKRKREEAHELRL